MTEVVDNAETLRQRIRANVDRLRELEVSGGALQGIPSASQDLIDDIISGRQRHAVERESEALRADRDRRQAEYCHILRVERPNQFCPEAAASEATPTADVDGKAIVMEPLKILFRIALLRCRVKKRLDILRDHCMTSAATQAVNAPQQAPQCMAAIPCMNVEHEDTSIPNGEGTDVEQMEHVSDLHNFDAFVPREQREPFDFKVKNYSAEKLPEFAVNVKAEAAKEVGVHHAKQTDAEAMPTIQHFAQPLVTLETHVLPSEPYSLQPIPSFGEGMMKSMQLPQADQMVTSCAPTKQKPLCLLPSSPYLLKDGFASLPKKIPAPLAEDSLSDSEPEDEQCTAFQPKLNWIPERSKLVPPTAETNSAQHSEQNSFDYYMKRFGS